MKKNKERERRMERVKIYFMSIEFSKAEMLEMENIVETFIKQNNIKITIPVDIFEIADFLGFDVRGAEFTEALEGLLLVNENLPTIKGFNSNKLIAYNCKKDIYMKKFIVAHELAHYISEKNKNIDKKIVLAARDHEDEYSNNKDEQKMDYIAACILMPKEDILLNFKNKKIEKTKLTDLISSRYNVSTEMAERRIKEILYV